jgi:hypothetical protein
MMQTFANMMTLLAKQSKARKAPEPPSLPIGGIPYHRSHDFLRV